MGHEQGCCQGQGEVKVKLKTKMNRIAGRVGRDLFFEFFVSTRRMLSLWHFEHRRMAAARPDTTAPLRSLALIRTALQRMRTAI